MTELDRLTRLASVCALAGALCAVSPIAVQAQDAKAAAVKAAKEAPCCRITAINSRMATVTGTVLATEQAFTFKVADAAGLRLLAVGQTLVFDPAPPTGCTGQAASSGSTGTTSGSGQACGSNVPRGADTRPKDCVATNSAGQQVAVPCPQNVPIRRAPRR